MVKLVETLNRLHPTKVMVVGDFMLDAYTIGKVKRISPEAPVSVLQVEREEDRPGGAGNAALNLLSLGTEVIVVGRVGNDTAGIKLREALSKEGINVEGLIVENGYQTPVKNRIIAENQQMMRLDFEKTTPLPLDLEEEILKVIKELLQDVKVIAISDYAKGFLTKSLLHKIFALAKSLNIPTIVDPKGIDFSKYKGATIIKPNLGEAIQASGLSADSTLDVIGAKLLQETQAEAFFITCSADGIAVFQKNQARQDFPVHVKEVNDVTGAGDTVLAMLAASVANDFHLHDAAALANIAAGIAIEHFGCARVSLSEVARRLLNQDSRNKIFDEEHLFALHMAVKGRPFTLLSIEGSLGMTSAIFKSIRQLASEKAGDLIVYVRDHLDPDFLHLLASLQEIDFIIIKKDSLTHLCETMKPHKVYILEKDQLKSNFEFSSLLSLNK